MSLKDNFNQALKELLKKDGLVGEDLSKDSKKKSELDRYLDRESAPSAPADSFMQQMSENEAIAESSNKAQESKTFGGFTPESLGLGAYNNKPESVQQTADKAAKSEETASSPFTSAAPKADFGFVPPPPAPQRNFGQPVNPAPSSRGQEPPYYETEETTVISRNTIIDGNIRSFANITIDGSVKGDVKITKNISITGKIVGDIECNNSTMIGASMQGNIASKGQVQMDRDSLLLGDIASQYLDLNGKIKGNVDVGGKAEFKTDAVILGNITASTITVLDGATIQGFVNTTFLQENSGSIFPETIAVSE